MTSSSVNPVTVLAAVNQGFTSRGDLEDYFDVLPGDRELRSALNDLEHHGHITVDRKKHTISPAL